MNSLPRSVVTLLQAVVRGAARLRARAPFIPCVIPASYVAATLWLGADSLSRNVWTGFGGFEHHVWAFTCVLFVALVPSSLLALLLELVHALPRRRHWAVSASRALVLATLGAWAMLPTARWAFSGARVSEQAIARWGPYAVTASVFVAASLGYGVLARVTHLQSEQRYWPARITALGLLAGAVLGIYIDLNFYVALYARLHVALEALSFVCALGAAGILARELALRSVRAEKLLWALALASSAASLVVVVSKRAVEGLEFRLTHVFREPVYVGRQLQRLLHAQAFIERPERWSERDDRALADLEERFGLADPKPDPAWTTPGFRASDRAGCAECSVLVFYVDTLRYDTAMNPALMPNVSRFRAQSLSFERAYATGSDTLSSLPGLTGGRYGLDEFSPHTEDDLLERSKALGLWRVLSIPESAEEFLTKLYPAFAFDERLVVRDYGTVKHDVWGYGAHLPSSEQLVDVTLERLSQAPRQRLLTWVFNFEVHSWMELDEDYLAEGAEQAQIPTDYRAWKYDAAAHYVDRQFGRLLDGLDELGLSDDTIVVFVSDHGEALGQWDFWRHGTMLWESVVRVPLMLRIPGVAPRSFERPVSLIDVAPTLATLLAPPRDRSGLRGYHGVDLIEFVEGRALRPFPLLFMGRVRDQRLRVGLLDPESRFKLVLPLETGHPQLYDTRSPAPDEEDLAKHRPRIVADLVDQLVRSPIYPHQPAVEPRAQ